MVGEREEGAGGGREDAGNGRVRGAREGSKGCTCWSAYTCLARDDDPHKHAMLPKLHSVTKHTLNPVSCIHTSHEEPALAVRWPPTSRVVCVAPHIAAAGRCLHGSCPCCARCLSTPACSWATTHPRTLATTNCRPAPTNRQEAPTNRRAVLPTREALMTGEVLLTQGPPPLACWMMGRATRHAPRSCCSSYQVGASGPSVF